MFNVLRMLRINTHKRLQALASIVALLTAILIAPTVQAQPQFANVQVANFSPYEDLSIQLKTTFATLPPTFFQGSPPIAYTAITGQIPAGIAITMTLFRGPDLQNLTPIDTLVATLKANGNYILAVMGGANGVPIQSRFIQSARFVSGGDDQIDYIFLNATTGTQPFRIDLLTNSAPYETITEMVSNFALGDTTEYSTLAGGTKLTFSVQENGKQAMRVQYDLTAARGKALMFVLTGQDGGEGEQAIRMLGFTSDADPSAENRITGQVPTNLSTDRAEVPDQFLLYGNYPNPFNPATMLRFSLPSSGDVSVTVFDLLGRQKQQLNLGLLRAGEQRVALDASTWPSGVYIYKVNYAGMTGVGKMTLVK
jgi:hypothetical protein